MKYLHWVFLFLLVAFALFRLYPHFADFSKIYDLKNHINYFYLTIGILAQSGQYIGDGLLSQTLLKIINVKMSFKNTIKIASLNVLAAHLFPVGEAGSITTAYYFYKKLGVSTQNFLFLSVSWSIITFTVLVVMFLISLLFIPYLPEFNFQAVAIGIIIAASAVAFIFFGARRFIWHKFKDKIVKLEIYNELVQFRESVHDHRKAILSHKILLIEAIVAATVYYSTNIVTLAFSFLTFGQLPPISVLTFAYALSMISGWVTLSPAGLGAAEATLLLVFLGFGLDPAQSIGAVLVFRFISFWIPIPAGAISYISLKKGINNKETSLYQARQTS